VIFGAENDPSTYPPSKCCKHLSDESGLGPCLKYEDFFYRRNYYSKLVELVAVKSTLKTDKDEQPSLLNCGNDCDCKKWVFVFTTYDFTIIAIIRQHYSNDNYKKFIEGLVNTNTELVLTGLLFSTLKIVNWVGLRSALKNYSIGSK